MSERVSDRECPGENQKRREIRTPLNLSSNKTKKRERKYAYDRKTPQVQSKICCIRFFYSSAAAAAAAAMGRDEASLAGQSSLSSFDTFCEPNTECVRLYDTTYRIFLTVPTVFRFCAADGPEENDPGPTKIWNMIDLSSWLVSVCQR